MKVAEGTLSDMKKHGFTLIELLVVISVLSILFVILLPNLIGARQRARDAAAKSDLAQLKAALRLYYNDFQKYPESSGGKIQGCGSGTSTCTDELSANGTMYMKALPSKFTYQKVNDDAYLVSVVLENAGDPDITASASKCNVSSPGTNNYYVCED